MQQGDERGEQPAASEDGDLGTAPVHTAGAAVGAAVTAKRRAEPLPAAIFARLVLVLAGMVWLAIGLWAMADPVALAESLDLELRSDLARLEIRAMYGGFSIALGGLHLLASTRAAWLVQALVSTTVLTAGLLTGRFLSIAVDGFPGVFALVLIGSELALVAVAALALWRLGVAARVTKRA